MTGLVENVNKRSSAVNTNSFTQASTSVPFSNGQSSRDSIENRQECCFYPTRAWQFVVYPFKLILSHLCRYRSFYYATYPIWIIWDRLVDFSDGMIYRYQNNFYPRIKIFPDREIAEMKRKYWGLGRDAWKEGIDGEYHRYGKYAFDFGLHVPNSVEPGFIRSWERGKRFMSEHLGEKLTPELFLEAHKTLTSHFVKSYGMLFSSERAGAFRDQRDRICWKILPNSQYRIMPEVENVIDRRVCWISAPDAEGIRFVNYRQMSAEQVRTYFQEYVDQFYASMETAFTTDEKLKNIATLFQRLEWLHSVPDGSGRTNVLILNFLLTEYGFHPTCLRLPYLADMSTIDVVLASIREGFDTWRQSAQIQV